MGQFLRQTAASSIISTLQFKTFSTGILRRKNHLSYSPSSDSAAGWRWVWLSTNEPYCIRESSWITWAASLGWRGAQNIWLGSRSRSAGVIKKFIRAINPQTHSAIRSDFNASLLFQRGSRIIVIGNFFATPNSIWGGPSRHLQNFFSFSAMQRSFQNANNSVARGYEIT